MSDAHRHGVATSELEVDGRPVRVLRAGRGRPVVFVHGLGLGAGFWRYHLERVAEAGYEGIAADMPGFGESPGPAFGFTVGHAASWLTRLARALEVGEAVWIGHSVSAQYVLNLALLDPELAAGLVLAAPTGEPGRFRWLAQLVGLARTAPREEPLLVRHVLAHYFSTPPTRVAGMWLGARRHRSLDDAARVACPIRVVLGERDPVVPVEFADALVATAAAADLVVIPGSAHGVALAPAEPFCRVMLDFLATTYPPFPVDNTAGARGNQVESA